MGFRFGLDLLLLSFLDICFSRPLFAFPIGSFNLFLFFPDSDSYGVLTSSNNELAVRAFETGVPVPAVVLVLGAVSWVLCAWWRLGAGAGRCELAVRVVETGCRCWCCELAVRVVVTRCWCWLCAWWRQGDWKAGKLRGS